MDMHARFSLPFVVGGLLIITRQVYSTLTLVNKLRSKKEGNLATERDLSADVILLSLFVWFWGAE